MTTEQNRREFEEYWEKEGVAIEPPVLQLAFKEVAEKAWQAARERLTEQRDGLRSGIDYASDQLHKVTEQRDRLVEALDTAAVALRLASKRHDEDRDTTGFFDAEIDQCEQALQSLTTKDHE
jgi:hypothetical protein